MSYSNSLSVFPARRLAPPPRPPRFHLIRKYASTTLTIPAASFAKKKGTCQISINCTAWVLTSWEMMSNLAILIVGATQGIDPALRGGCLRSEGVGGISASECFPLFSLSRAALEGVVD